MSKRLLVATLARQSFIAMLLLCGTAVAHPGHGPFPESTGPEHYLFSPAHWAVVAALIILGTSVAWFVRRQAIRWSVS